MPTTSIRHNSSIKHNLITTFEIERLSDALESEWWNKDEFFVFSGHLPPPVLNVPYRQDYYSFFIPDSGKMVIEIDVQQYTIAKNDLLFTNPLQIIQMHSISPDTSGKVIAFKKTFLDGEVFNPTEKLSFINHASPHFSLKADEATMIGDLIEDMKLKLENQKRPNRRQVAINLISVLLHEIDAIFRLENGKFDKKTSKKEVINNQFHNLISLFFLKERSVTFYADMLNISARHLNALTKDITGKTAGDQINEMIIREAKIFLKNSNLSIKQIAEMHAKVPDGIPGSELGSLYINELRSRRRDHIYDKNNLVEIEYFLHLYFLD